MTSLILQIIVDSLLLGGITLMAVGVARLRRYAHHQFRARRNGHYGAYGAFFAFVGLHLDPLLSLPLVAVVGGIGGYLLFRLSLEKILDDVGINQVLLTFGIGSCCRTWL